MRKLFYALSSIVILLLACQSKQQTNKEERYKTMMKEHLVRNEKSYYGDINRFTDFDSAFTKVTDETYYRSLLDDLHKLWDEREEYNENIRNGYERWSSSKIIEFDKREEEIRDMMNYRAAIFKPRFIGFSCIAESKSPYNTSYHEFIFDSTMTRIISSDLAFYNDENNQFSDYEVFDSVGLKGTRNPFFKDIITQPCISSILELKGEKFKAATSGQIAIVNNKKHILNKDGTLSTTAFDEPLQSLFQSYSSSDIMLIKNEGKYGVMDCWHDTLLLPCIYDKCEISSKRIIASKDGKQTEYYPDGTPVK